MLNPLPEALLQAAATGSKAFAIIEAIVMAVAAVIVVTGCYLAYRRRP